MIAMRKTGHIMEQADIQVCIGLLLNEDTSWHSHSEIVQFCTEMMGYKPHEDCVRTVCKRMVKRASAELAVNKGNFLYRRTTALWSPRMVHIHARKAK